MISNEGAAAIALLEQSAVDGLLCPSCPMQNLRLTQVTLWLQVNGV